MTIYSGSDEVITIYNGTEKMHALYNGTESLLPDHYMLLSAQQNPSTQNANGYNVEFTEPGIDHFGSVTPTLMPDGGNLTAFYWLEGSPELGIWNPGGVETGWNRVVVINRSTGFTLLDLLRTDFSYNSIENSYSYFSYPGDDFEVADYDVFWFV